MKMDTLDEVGVNPEGEDGDVLAALRESQLRERAYTLLAGEDPDAVEYFVEKDIMEFCRRDLENKGRERSAIDYAGALSLYADPEVMPDADFVEQFHEAVANRNKPKIPYTFDQPGPSPELVERTLARVRQETTRAYDRWEPNMN